MVPDFFEQAKKTGKMNFASLAHVVQIENTGVRTLTPRKQGLQHLRFERGKRRWLSGLVSFAHGIDVEHQLVEKSYANEESFGRWNEHTRDSMQHASGWGLGI